jgi:hypothetical protein
MDSKTATIRARFAQSAGALIVAILAILVGNYLWDRYTKWQTGTANLDVVLRLHPNLASHILETSYKDE